MSCTGKSWAPSWWSSPTETKRTYDYVDIYQYFSWDTQHHQALMNWLNTHGGQYQHEVRRHKEDKTCCLNVWDFLRGEWLWCTAYFASNLPDPDPFESEESNWPWQCLFEVDFDEEAEIIARNSKSIVANKNYYCHYRFWRLDRNKNVWLIWESEMFGSYGNVEYCDMWTGFWAS